MKYRRITQVEAVQWFKMGDHPLVMETRPKIQFSAGRDFYYVHNLDPECVATSWLPVRSSPYVDDIVRSFWLWKMQSGERQDAEHHPGLVGRAVIHEKWKHPPRTVHWLNRPYYETLLVFPGDWIVEENKLLKVVSDSDFQQTFEKII